MVMDNKPQNNKKNNYKMVFFGIVFFLLLVFLYLQFQEGKIIKLSEKNYDNNDALVIDLFKDKKYNDSNGNTYRIPDSQVAKIRLIYHYARSPLRLAI
jgi:hypothetical protein